jgi:hypothetical protein
MSPRYGVGSSEVKSVPILSPFDGADPRFDYDLGILQLRHSPRRLRRALQRRFVIVEDGESALDLGR